MRILYYNLFYAQPLHKYFMTNTDNLTPLGINPVADILEALMNKHRLSQTALSNRSGVSQPAINRILNERSRAKHPRKETLQNY